MSKTWKRRRKRIFEIIEVGNDLDRASRAYDFLNALAIIVNFTPFCHCVGKAAK